MRCPSQVIIFLIGGNQTEKRAPSLIGIRGEIGKAAMVGLLTCRYRRFRKRSSYWVENQFKKHNRRDEKKRVCGGRPGVDKSGTNTGQG